MSIRFGFSHGKASSAIKKPPHVVTVDFDRIDLLFEIFQCRSIVYPKRPHADVSVRKLGLLYTAFLGKITKYYSFCDFIFTPQLALKI